MDEYAEIFNARGHSYNEASSICPMARERERRAVIDRLDVRSGDRIIDAPAGGGYLADGLTGLGRDRIEVTCVEPALRFAEAIAEVHQVVVAPMANTGLPDRAYDAIASLAGLHHVADPSDVFEEWKRLLKPSGRLVVADVQGETPTAEFLNGFVDQHTPGGHRGMFFHPGDWTKGLVACGFKEVHERLVDVFWPFDSIEQLALFCKKLFFLKDADVDDVAEATRRIVGVLEHDDGTVELKWQLRIATAQAV